MKEKSLTTSKFLALTLLTIGMFTATAEAQTVKITPLGSHAGEFCRNDRAMLFEDPTGVRILYDPGRTVDETDGLLGIIHAVLLSSVHPDGRCLQSRARRSRVRDP